jgi:uncharacterized membrane protein YeaQ/YmgE (transglycosylase-associated protein family)
MCHTQRVIRESADLMLSCGLFEDRRSVSTKGGSMSGILVMIVLGLIIGAVAKFVMPGDDPGGIIVTILLGIAGALVGGFLGRLLGLYQEGQPAGFLMSVVGALVLLFGYRLLTRQRA